MPSSPQTLGQQLLQEVPHAHLLSARSGGQSQRQEARPEDQEMKQKCRIYGKLFHFSITFRLLQVSFSPVVLKVTSPSSAAREEEASRLVSALYVLVWLQRETVETTGLTLMLLCLQKQTVAVTLNLPGASEATAGLRLDSVVSNGLTDAAFQRPSQG